VVAVTGEAPCEAIDWRGGRLLYFHLRTFMEPRHECARPDAIEGPAVASRDKFPQSKYAHLQILLDKAGKVVAETVVAESSCVRTHSGEHDGLSAIEALPPKVYSDLVGH